MTLLAREPRVPRSLMPASNDGRLIAILTALLVAATWPFFHGFSVLAGAAGLLTSAAIRWWFNRHPSELATPNGMRRRPEINFSAIPIGGDAGGLILVCGCLAICLLGIPSLRVFMAGSIAFAATMAALLIGWRKHHEIWSRTGTSLRLRNGF